MVTPIASALPGIHCFGRDDDDDDDDDTKQHVAHRFFYDPQPLQGLDAQRPIYHGYFTDIPLFFFFVE